MLLGGGVLFISYIVGESSCGLAINRFDVPSVVVFP